MEVCIRFVACRGFDLAVEEFTLMRDGDSCDSVLSGDKVLRNQLCIRHERDTIVCKFCRPKFKLCSGKGFSCFLIYLLEFDLIA